LIQARFSSAGVTDPGKVRAYNEDAFLDAPQHRLWVVADGMGGHSAGDYASRTIVERLAKVPPAAQIADYVDAVEKELDAVNDDLQRYARQQHVALVGATIVLLIAGPEYMVCGWAGDSRAYRFHDGKLEQLSRDHSALQEMMDSGQFQVHPGESAPRSNAITRAVGGEQKLFLDWMVATWTPGTQFLLCTDGVTKELADHEIEEALKQPRDPKQAAEGVVRAAIDRGGRDNTTALLVRVDA